MPGQTWTKMATPIHADVFQSVRIDPITTSAFMCSASKLHISDDGGKTFRSDGRTGSNSRGLSLRWWINPANSNHTMIGGDGGVGFSYDKSKTYVWLKNMPLGHSIMSLTI